jgi:hypothetical protein
VTQVFSITNGGGVATNLMSGGGLTAPYSFPGGYPGMAAGAGVCGATLGVGLSCNITVAFNPTASGTFNNTISISYDNGAATVSATRAITGAGVPAGLLTITPPAGAYSFGNVTVGSSKTVAFTLTNAGGVAVSGITGGGLTGDFSYQGGFPGAGGDCVGTLAVGATCTFTVKYAPSGTGNTTSTINIAYNDGVVAQNATKAVDGTGISIATLAFADGASYNFGNRPTGSTVAYLLTVNNTGGSTATLMNSISISAPFTFTSGAYPGHAAAGACGATLPAAGTCTISVSYSPTALGALNQNLDLTYNNGAANVTSTINVQGTGVNPASLAITSAPYNFGNQPTTSTTDVMLTVTNSGSFAATSIAFSGLTAPYSYTGNGTCTSGTVAAGGTCTVEVRYNPTATGAITQTMTVTYFNGSASVSSTGTVTGTGVTPAALVIDQSPLYNYGTIASGTSADFVFTLTNNGGFQATSVSGGGLALPFSFPGGSFPGMAAGAGVCTGTLAAGASCSFTVRYSPTAVATDTGTIDISFNNGLVGGNHSTRNIQGAGTTPANLVITEAPTYGYGTGVVGGVYSKTYTITNTGATTATAISGSALTLPFAYPTTSTFPGAGGTCTPTLAASATCTFVVTYSPTAPSASDSDTVTVSYNNGSGVTSTNVAINGAAVTPPQLVITGAPAAYDYGLVAQGSITDVSFTVTNTGGANATSVSETGLVAPFSRNGGTCGATINAGANCTVIVRYNPTSTGHHTGTITMSYSNTLATVTATRPVQGDGGTPATLAITGAPTAFDYGNVTIGGFSDNVFTVTNNGDVPATGLSGAVTGKYSFNGGFPGMAAGAGVCTGTLAAHTACTFTVRYTPTTSTTDNGTVTLTFNDGATAGQTSTIPVTGAGKTPAALTLTGGSPYDFGTVATNSVNTVTLTVTNTGETTATAMGGSGLAAPFTFANAGNTYPGTPGTCTTFLAGGATCTLTVKYVPTATGLLSDTLDIAYNTGLAGATLSRVFQGTGANPATLTISNSGFDFGSVAIGATPTQVFTINNTGGVDATSVVLSGISAPYSVTANTCAATITAGGNCAITVKFTPTTTGLISNTITLTYNNGVAAGQTSTNTIQGTGSNPALLAISNTSYDFGNTVIGQSPTNKWTFTLTNNGGVQATGITGGGLALPFRYVGGTFPGGGTCTGTLNPTISCTFVVEYVPTATGAASSTISIGYNNGVSGQTVTNGVTGTGKNPALLTLTGASPYDFGIKATGSTTNVILTLQNVGDVPATSLGGTGLAAPFTLSTGNTFPGAGGNCLSTLGAGSTCTISVDYKPTANGALSDILDVTYADGTGSTITLSRTFQGTGAAPGALTITNVGYNFGTKSVGSTNTQSFTLQNTGGVDVTSITGSGLAAPFTFNNGGNTFPGGGTCTGTLTPGQTCTLVVKWAPTGAGAQSDTIDINFDNGVAAGQLLQNTISGTAGTPPVLTLSAATYDFGVTPLTTTKTYTINVTYSGGVPAQSVVGTGLGAPINFETSGIFPGATGTCTSPISANCTIVVTYSPTASVVTNKTLTVQWDDGLGTQSTSIALTGTGKTKATLGIDQSGFTYGLVATDSINDNIFTVTNSGELTANNIADGLTLAAPFSFSSGAYPGHAVAGACGTTLAAGATCTIKVRYNPTVAAAADSSTITLTYDDGINTGVTTTRAIAGAAQTKASLTIVDPGTYGTKATGSVTDVLVTVNNTGTASATSIAETTLAAPFTFASGSFPGHAGAGKCTATLAGGGSCTLMIRYNPTTTGAHAGTITLNYNNGAATVNATRALSGTGANPATLTIGAASFDFGIVPRTTTQTYTINVTYTGGVAATGVNIAGLGAPFTYPGGSYPGGGTCPVAGTISANCTIIVQYAPTTSAVHTASLTIGYNDGAAAQTIPLALQGTGKLKATLAIDQAGFTYGTVATDSINDNVFTVSNSGEMTANNLIDGLTLAAPYSFSSGAYPGDTAGTKCGSSLAAGATCTIKVRYNPTVASAADNATITLKYDDGINTAVSTTRAITGVAQTKASLTIVDPGNFGTKATGSTTDVLVTVNNTGTTTATGLAETTLAAPFTFTSGSYPGHAGAGKCGATIPGSSSCTIMIRYAPTTVGAHAGTVTLTYNDGAANVSATRALAGTGANPATLTIPVATYDFGVVPRTTTQTYTINVTYTGGVTATGVSVSGLGAPFTFPGGSYPGGGTCPVGGTISANCTIIVQYAPTTSAVHNASLTINYNNGASAQTVPLALTGTGKTAGLLAIDQAGFNYGLVAVNSTNDNIFNVTNNGEIDVTSIADGLTLAAPYTFSSGAYPGHAAAGACGTTLTAGASCTISVRYKPTGVSAGDNATITLSYNNGIAGGQTVTRAVTGSAQTAASLTIVDPGTFGTKAVNSVTDVLVTVNNTGSAQATSISETTLAAPFTFASGSFPGHAGAGKCTATLAGGGSCTLMIRYNPTTTGAHAGTITLGYNNGVTTVNATRGLTGTGANAAALTIGAASYDFGITPRTTTKTYTINVTYTGGVAATGVSITGLGAPFTYPGGTYPGGGTCPAGGSISANCTIIVQYAPTTSAVHTASLTINYNDGAAAQTIPLALQGTGKLKATLAITPAAFNYGTQIVGSTTSQVFTVTNSGELTAANLADGATLAAPFSMPGGYPGHAIASKCGNSLAAAGTCTINVDFAPVAAGSPSSTITLSYDDGISTGVTTTNAVNGTAVTAANLTITNPGGFGTKATGSNTDVLVTVNNTGSTNATSVTESTLGGTFKFTSGSYPGHAAAGACGTTINAGSSCTLSVRYNPTTLGAHTGTITLGYNNGVIGTASATQGLTGTGAAPASLSFAVASYSWGSKTVNTSTDVTINVTYSGGVSATALSASGLSAPIGFKTTGTLPGATGTCTAPISANCTIVLTYNPTTGGTTNETLSLQYNDGAATQTITLPLDGTAITLASLAITQASADYTFGPITKNTTDDIVFTVTNSGGTDATLVADGGPLAAPYSFPSGYPGMGPGAGVCTATITAGSSCTMTVRYSPTAASAADNATITLTYNNGSVVTTATRAVVGSAVNPATLTINNSGAFGNVTVGATADLPFTITNSGNSTATLSAETLGADYTFPGGWPGTAVATKCGTTIAAGATCDVVVRYSPSGTGLNNQTFTVTYNNGAVAGQTATKALSGTGVSVANLNITGAPAVYDYGNVTAGGFATQTFTLNNTGGSAATLTAETVGGMFAFSGGGTFPGGGTCSTGTVAAGGSCTFIVKYSPTTTVAHSSTITITYDNGATSGNTTTRGVQGTGVTAAVLTLSAGTANFGSTPAGGGTVDITLTVTKTGTTDATSLTEISLAAPFQWANAGNTYPGAGGTCSTTITATCTIVVRFKPTTAGTFNGNVNLQYYNGYSTVNTGNKALTGIGASPATLSIAPSGTWDYGIVLNGYNADKTFTITNTGGVDATSMTYTGLTAPYSYPGGGTCGATLTTGSSCTLIIRYSPTTTATHSQTASIGFNDGVTTQSSTQALTGKGYVMAATIARNTPAAATGNNPTPILDVGSVISGVTVQLHTNNTCTALKAGSVSSGTTISLTSSALTDGAYNFYVKVIDTNGNGVCGTATVGYAVDTTAPTAPTGWTMTSPSSGTTSNDNTPVVLASGLTTEVGSTGAIYSDAACGSLVASATVDVSGNLSISPTYLTNGTDDGVKTYYGKITDPYGNASACTNLSLGYTLDTTAPNAVTINVDTTAWRNSTTTSATFSWLATTSPDLNHYEVALGTTSGGNQTVAWVTNGTTLSKQFTGLTLTQCTTYYPSVKVVDNAGNNSTVTTFTAFTPDTTAPNAPTALTNASDMSTSQTPTLSWTAATDNCGATAINYYELAVGTTSGGSDVVAWTNIGNVTSKQVTGISLSRGTNYYTSLRTVDKAGNTGLVATSASWSIPAPALVASGSANAATATTSAAASMGTAGTDRMMVIVIIGNDASVTNKSVGSVAISGGGTVSRVTFDQAAGGGAATRAEIWYTNEAGIAAGLTSAPTGIVITPTWTNGAPSNGTEIYWYVFNNVSQSITPVGNSANNANAATVTTGNAAAVASGIMVCGGGLGGRNDSTNFVMSSSPAGINNSGSVAGSGGPNAVTFAGGYMVGLTAGNKTCTAGVAANGAGRVVSTILTAAPN